MDLYIKLFEVLFPVFFVVGIGYYLGRKNPKLDTTFITNFGANIGSPAIIFYSVATTGLTFDFISNGFKCRSNDPSLNADGGTYVYIAFAKLPFVSSEGIPTTAR